MTINQTISAVTIPTHGTGNRLLHQKHRSLYLNTIAALGFAIAIGAYIWFIHHYGVDTIYGDQWGDVNILAHSYSGTLSFSTLWAQHNEERMLFPNLIVLLIGRTTHLNLFVEMYLSAALLIIAVFLICLAHKRRSPDLSWVFYVPVFLMMLSFVQYGTTLWGFQLCFFLVILCLSLSLFLLDSPSAGRLGFITAVVAATVGSYSCLQGLFIWPVCLLILYQRKRSRSMIIGWILSATIVTLGYFYNFNRQAVGAGASSPTDAIAHFGNAIHFFLIAMGGVLGNPNPNVQSAGSSFDILFGAGTVALAIVALILGFRRDPKSGNPLGIGLIVFGLLFGASIVVGRSAIGLWGAFQSRYATNDLTVIVGIYLVFVGSYRSRVMPLINQRSSRLLATVTLIAVALQITLGFSNGLAGARVMHQTQEDAADSLANFEVLPRSWIANLYPLGPEQLVSRLAPIAKQHRLSEFSTSFADFESERGVIAGWMALGDHGTPAEPVQPNIGLVPGETVHVKGFVGIVPAGKPVMIFECNHKLLSNDKRACSTSDVERTWATNNAISTTYRIVGGRVGDGSCSWGQICFIDATWDPSDVWLQSWVEIRMGQRTDESSTSHSQ